MASKVDQTCPVKLDVFDLKTDRLVKRFVIPKNQTTKESLFTNVVVEIVDNNCGDAHAYMSDVFQYGLVVYSLKKVKTPKLVQNVIPNYFFFTPPPPNNSEPGCVEK